MRNGWNWKYPLSYMYPAHTQLLAKWSSPSIGDRRATGWEVQSSKTSQLLSMHRYFLFSVMFSSFPLISPTKILPWKARAKSSDNWYCQLSCYALKGIVWGLWDSGTPRIQSTRFYQQDRRSVELSQSESPQHFHRTANVQRPLLSLFCQNQTGLLLLPALLWVELCQVKNKSDWKLCNMVWHLSHEGSRDLLDGC